MCLRLLRALHRRERRLPYSQGPLLPLLPNVTIWLSLLPLRGHICPYIGVCIVYVGTGFAERFQVRLRVGSECETPTPTRRPWCVSLPLLLELQLLLTLPLLVQL